MRGGVPHRGGLPSQLDWVTHLAGVSFLHVKAEGGVTRLTGVMSIRAFINMAATHYKPGELLVKKNSFSEENTKEVDGASDNLSVETDSKAELLKCLKEYKVTCDFNDFEQDLSAMYTEIR